MIKERRNMFIEFPEKSKLDYRKRLDKIITDYDKQLKSKNIDFNCILLICGKEVSEHLDDYINWKNPYESDVNGIKLNFGFGIYHHSDHIDCNVIMIDKTKASSITIMYC
jgi:hypothetical protein